MANPLEIGSVSPPPPNPDAGNALQSGPAMPPQAQGQAQGQAPVQAPAPSHAQTVAALRHFGAIGDELKVLLSNTSLGKSDIKSQIIDGVTSLVSKRIMKPAEAVVQLAQVPEDPLQQRKWLQGLMTANENAAHSVLDSHRNTSLGSGDWAVESQQHNTNPDDHMNDIAALSAHYKGSK